MHRTSKQRRPRTRAENRPRGGSPVVTAVVIGAFAVLAVIALPAVVPSASSRARVKSPYNNWDAATGASQAGLESIARGTRAATAAQTRVDPVANVRDQAMHYKAARLAEIKDQIAKIDAAYPPTAADEQRRQALLAEQQRLLRY